jgi:protein involved in polysaccharide export with SLBB domain
MSAVASTAAVGAQRRKTDLVRAIAALSLLALSGCAATKHQELVSFVRAHETEVSTGSYIVRPPDVITINAPGAAEVDGTTQRVRSDGKIVLRLLGEVDVAGLTSAEIAVKLKAQLERYYVAPEVVVQVAGYYSQFYYVFGEVMPPGPKNYTGRDTLLQALADAKPTYLAWKSKVRVTRPAVDEPERRTIVVDLEHMLQTGDLTANVLLQEGDVIDVPPTPIAWVGHRVRELLYPVDPALRAYEGPAAAAVATEVYQHGPDWNDNHDDNNKRNVNVVIP